MNKSDYAILSIIGVITVVIGVVTTYQPLGTFFAGSARQAATTIVAMAWITWWALVIGFVIAGGVEAWVSTQQISRHFGHRIRSSAAEIEWTLTIRSP